MYRIGTISINDGDSVLVGEGTEWLTLASAQAGYIITLPDNLFYLVTAVTDDEHISIERLLDGQPYSGPDLTGADYALMLTALPQIDAALAQNQINLLIQWREYIKNIQSWLFSDADTANITTHTGQSLEIYTPTGLLNNGYSPNQAILVTDTSTFATSPTGDIDSDDLPVTNQFSVLRGTVNETALWTITVSHSGDVTYTHDGNGGVTVTAFGSDNATITFTASRDNHSSMVRTWHLVKQKQGVQGIQGPQGEATYDIIAPMIFKYDVETAQELAESTPNIVGIRGRCRARADANYILEPPTYTAKVGDIVTASNYVWRLLVTDQRNVNLRLFGLIPGDRDSGVDCVRAAIALLTPLGSGKIVIPDFGDDISDDYRNTLITHKMITMPTFITFTGETMRSRWWVDFNHEDADFPLIPFRGIYYMQTVRVAVLHGMIWDETEQDLKPHPAQNGEVQTRKRVYKPQFNDFEIRAYEGNGGIELDTIGFLTGVGLRSQATRTADFLRCSIRGFACKISHTEVFSDAATIKNCILTSYNVALRNLATIMFGFGIGNEAGDLLPSNGDGCLVETCQFGYTDGAPIPHIAAASRSNIRVIGNINPSLYAYHCTMVEYASNKNETGWIRIDGPSSIISHNEISNYAEINQTDTPAFPITLLDSSDKTLNGESTQPMHILEHNAFQRRPGDFRGGTGLIADVVVDYSVRVEIKDCYQNVGLRIGSQKLGIKVRRLDGVTPIGDWDALSHLYSKSSTILANQGIHSSASLNVTQNETDVFKNKFPGFGITEDTRNDALPWTAAEGTYFYKYQILLDANVGIGVTLEVNQSIVKTAGANATILEYRETPDDRNHAFEDVILRVYRGNADGVYDSVVNLNCIAIKNIWDYGDIIATSEWGSRTPGPVDDIIEMASESYFWGYKLNGDGTKTLTGGLSAKKLNVPTVYVLKEERQFAFGFPEFLKIITHDKDDKTRSGREFRMLRSGDFIAAPWEPEDFLIADSYRVTSDGSVWHYSAQGTTGTDEPTAVGADGTATIDALVSTNGIYYRASRG